MKKLLFLMLTFSLLLVGCGNKTDKAAPAVERLPSHFTVEVDVLQSLLSERLAVEWMGDHKYLKPSDQKIYDGEE